MRTDELWDLGYALPAYSIKTDCFCYRYRDKHFYSNHKPSVALPGLGFKVAKLEDAKAKEVNK